MSEDIIIKINAVINDYLTANPSINSIAIKEIMPAMVEAGVFTKDEKKGLPLRKILRSLNKSNDLDKVPAIYADKRDTNIYWYIVREGSEFTPKEPVVQITKKQKRALAFEASDEYYLVDLCDEILDQKASRQHTFNTLLGDEHRDGRTRTKLPLDAFYQELKLVVEFTDTHNKVKTYENPDKITISGVNRERQREIYTKRKKDFLFENGINLVEIDYSDFNFDNKKALVRDKKTISKIINKRLNSFTS